MFKLFKKGVNFKGVKTGCVKCWEITAKTVCILFIPIPIMVPVFAAWYLIFLKNHAHFSDGMEGIVTAAWIPVFGILYSLLAVIEITTVWTEYKTIRTAVKQYDIDKFMELRDEEMSPLLHIIVVTFSVFLLTGFMALNYPSFRDGTIVVMSTAYLLTLILAIIIEIDNPCSGFWFIKSITEEWLKINPKT